MTLNLRLTKYQASCVTHAVFTQAGKFVMSGHLEECEQEALRIRGLFCRVHRGRPIIRFDFEDTEDN
jgi:hypothetical protein